MDKKAMLRQRRHRSIRKRIAGTADRPRLNVFRSLANTYAQVIDDDAGRTLAAASTLDAEVKSAAESGGKKDSAKLVGLLVGKRAVEQGIEKVVLDRGGWKYHGRVASLADGAREAGLKF